MISLKITQPSATANVLQCIQITVSTVLHWTITFPIDNSENRTLFTLYIKTAIYSKDNVNPPEVAYPIKETASMHASVCLHVYLADCLACVPLLITAHV